MKGSSVLWKDGRGTPTSFTDGRYAVTLPTPGTYRIELKGPGYAKSSQEIHTEPGRIYKINFTLQAGGVIKGKVIDGAGRPYQEGDVFYLDGNTSFGVPVERDGTFIIDGLSPGDYKLTVMIGDRKVSRIANAEAGKVTIADFVLK